MENWKKIWHDALAPLLSTSGLEALRQALVRDDPRLIQQATSNPAPAEIFQEEAIEGACALGFCAWKGDGLDTVGEVEAFLYPHLRSGRRSPGRTIGMPLLP